MNDKRTPEMAPDADPALAALIADLEAIHAAPLSPRMRATIRGSIQQRMHMLPASPHTREARTARADAGALIEGSATVRRPARAWPALIAATLAVVCLALLATLARRVGGIIPTTTPTSTPAVSTAAAEYSATICGFRVTVTRAYADANRVFVGYSIAPPAGRNFLDGIDGMAALRTMQGAALRGGTAGGPAAFGDAGNHFSPLGRARGTEQIAAFESDGAIVPGRHVTLVLSISDLQTTEYVGSRPVVRACERYGASGGGLRQVTVPGPFTFQFTVPVQAAIRQAALHWVIGSGRDQETVDRIVATPTETRIYVHGSAIYPPQIAISGVHPYHGPDANGWRQGAEKVFVYDDYASYFPSLYRKPNPWTLAILGGNGVGNYGVGTPVATIQVNLS